MPDYQWFFTDEEGKVVEIDLAEPDEKELQTYIRTLYKNLPPGQYSYEPRPRRVEAEVTKNLPD